MQLTVMPSRAQELPSEREEALHEKYAPLQKY